MATETDGGKSSEPGLTQMPVIRVIDAHAPLRWLRAAWNDVRHAPGPALFYGCVLATMGAILVNTIASGAIGLAFMTGFLIVGPFLLMGLYEIARSHERGTPVSLAATMVAWRANLPAVGFLSCILALLLAVWLRVSVVVVALFFPRATPQLSTLLIDLLQSGDGWTFLGAYALAGFGFALFVFSSAVVSLPMMLDRPRIDTLTAMITSCNAVRINLRPLALWAALIVAIIGAGFVTWFAGLVLAVPLIGCASWHAYRELVAPDAAPG